VLLALLSCSTEDWLGFETDVVEVELEPGERALFEVHIDADGRHEPVGARVLIFHDELDADGTLDFSLSCGGSGRIGTLEGDRTTKPIFTDPVVTLPVEPEFPIELDCRVSVTASPEATDTSFVGWVAELELHYVGRKDEPDTNLEVEPVSD
jgi:hypothetical protein